MTESDLREIARITRATARLAGEYTALGRLPAPYVEMEARQAVEDVERKEPGGRDKGDAPKKPRGPDAKTLEGVRRMKAERQSGRRPTWKRLARIGGFGSIDAAKKAWFRYASLIDD